MRLCRLLLILALPALAGEQYATWDKLFLKPEVPMVAIAPEGTVTLLVYHQYPAALHNLRARAVSDELTLTSEPAALANMPPTEIHSIKLTAKRRAGATGDMAKVTVTFSADEMTKPTTWDLDVPLTQAGEKAANAPLTMPAGEVQVVVVRSSRGTYLFQIAITLLLLGWWWWRKQLIRKR